MCYKTLDCFSVLKENKEGGWTTLWEAKVRTEGQGWTTRVPKGESKRGPPVVMTETQGTQSG